ncbi:TniQ family protein, partial [Antrihabitans cavernicola]
MPHRPPARSADRGPTPQSRPIVTVRGGGIDRWPIAVPVGDGEAVFGWLVRVSHRYGLTPRQVLQHTGIRAQPASVGAVSAALAADTGVLSATLGLPITGLQASVAPVPLDVALRQYLTNYHCVDYKPRPGSRFCPCCLADADPRWQAGWFSPLQLVCERHQVHLRVRCPSCEQVPFSTVAWLGRVTETYRCPQRRSRDRVTHPRRVMAFCRQDLRRVDVVTADGALVAAQQQLSALAATMIVDPL